MPPAVENRVIDFVPVVRNSRRAPNILPDDEKQQSVLSWFGSGYVLVAGKDVGKNK